MATMKKWTDKKIDATRGEILAYTLHTCERVLYVYGIKIDLKNRMQIRNAISTDFDDVFSNVKKMFKEFGKLDQEEIDKMIQEIE